MYPSPLTLERHFFTKVLIDTHVDGELGTANLLNCDIELGRTVDKERRFQVILRLKLESPPDRKATYTGEIHVVGLFRVADVYPEEKINSLIQANGCGILFGAIRELLLNLTSRGPWPPVMLNTFSFLPPQELAVKPSEKEPEIAKR